MPFIHTNNIRLHYIEHSGNGPLLILMHGLTANAHAFDGLMEEGLDKHFRILSVDLRGRGLSDHPPFPYGMEDHAQDILGLLDTLGEERAMFCGHSFGGLLSFYLAANYAGRVERLAVLDAAARMNPNAAEMLSFRLSTLDVHYPTMADYMKEVKSAPYNTFWSNMMNSYYKADVRPLDEGGVTPRPQFANIMQASLGVAAVDWPATVRQVNAPVLLVNAPENYALGEPLLPPELARETVSMLPHAKLVTVEGNHQTMLYGEGARQITDALVDFAARA